ncbi:response regulator transcription factor [Kitasatospora sp. NPDC051984]|uniref:response regulator transcription factor n=1 Tax=Kitasatospora sp. NPDC051984 TaxID=3364059 RepID=UPI0037C596BE
MARVRPPLPGPRKAHHHRRRVPARTLADPAALGARLIGQVRRPAPTALSARELEILGLIAKGTTNREAARQLFISEATVKTHLLHLYAKLHATDRASAVAAGFSQGYLTP